MYFSGQGKVYLAPRNLTTGQPINFMHVGNVPELNLELSSDTVEHKESRSGLRVVDKIITTMQKIALNLTLEEFNAANFQKAVYGTPQAITGATIFSTPEVLPTGLVVGDYVRLQHGNVTTLVLKDNTGSPVTLVLGTHYEITNALTGMIKILSVAGLTQTTGITATYVYGNSKGVSMFTAPRKEFWLRFDGLNTAEGSVPVIVDLYKVTLNPTSSMQLISDEISKFPLAGFALYDALQSSGNIGGQFGFIDFLDPTY